MMHEELVDVTERYEAQAVYWYNVSWTMYNYDNTSAWSYKIPRDERIKAVRYSGGRPDIRGHTLIYFDFPYAPIQTINSGVILEDGTLEVSIDWPENAENIYINGAKLNPPHIYKLE